MAYYKKNVRIGRTTDRTLGFIAPTVSDELCPHFHKRFIRHGVALPENRAICEKKDIGTFCDYLKEVDGIPFCMRYWYGPKYDIVDLVRTPYIQIRNDKGSLLYYELDGVTETTNFTAHPVMRPVHEANPLIFTKEGSEAEQETTILPGETEPKPLFWKHVNGEQPVKTTEDTGYPVQKYGNMEFYSDQFVDTHEKRYRINDNVLGWHKNV